MTNNYLLEFSNITKKYGSKVALDNVSFNLEPGKIIGLLGPNGSGKSTILKLVNGLLQPTEGEIKIMGNPPGIMSKSIISYLPERTYLNEWMKISDLINFFADFYILTLRHQNNKTIEITYLKGILMVYFCTLILNLLIN